VGLVRKRSLTALGVAVFVVFVFASVSQVWADTLSPNPVIADQPFSISGVGGGGFGSLYHGSLCDNGGSVTAITAVFDPSSGPFTDNFGAQQAGPYSFSHDGDPSGCVPFTIVPASIPEYPYGLTILAVFMVVGCAVIKRRTKTA